MASQVEIVNLALNALGESDFILAINENTKSARIANLVWESAKKKVLEDHPWKFACKRVSLSPLTGVPVYEYTSQFQLPADFIKVVEVFDADMPIDDFEINENKILCNVSSIFIKYVANITNTEIFSPSFTDCFSIFIAHKMAYAITGSRSKESDLAQMYIKELNIAKENDASNMTPKPYKNENLWYGVARDGGFNATGRIY